GGGGGAPRCGGGGGDPLRGGPAARGVGAARQQLGQVPRSRRRERAIGRQVEPGRSGPAVATIHEARRRHVERAAHDAAQLPPPAARARHGHAVRGAAVELSGGSPRSRAAVSAVAAATAAVGTLSSSAARAAVTGRYAGSLRWPRHGWGGRYGQSVSITSRSSGKARTTSASRRALGYVTGPAIEIRSPSSIPRRATARSPEK